MYLVQRSGYFFIHPPLRLLLLKEDRSRFSCIYDSLFSGNDEGNQPDFYLYYCLDPFAVKSVKLAGPAGRDFPS